MVLAGAPAYAQNDIAEWFPVHAGDKWTYAYETRDENGRGRAHPEIRKWTTEETVSVSWTVPEGLVVVRQVRSTPPAHDRAFLIRGDCVYQDVAWDAAARQIKDEYRKGLATWLAPDFCFPLTVGKTWGAPHGLPDWGVTRPEDAKDWRVAGKRRKTFHVTSISGYPGSGETVDIWFEKGVGVVRQDDIHHGTLGERHVRLVRFEPAVLH